ncbi:MAG: tRNA uridine-5-carboxymethylaminomethyl(34) synthesis GTPase MnmE [Pseudomonadota bacterium]
MSDTDTIFAKASGAGRAGVAVFRLSGPAALAIARALIGSLPPPRDAKLVKVTCPDTEQLIDEGLVILFKGPASFTGEDVVEFHLHGSSAVEAALFHALLTLKARPAEAGEFTRRALINGKLDLAQVEALADLIDAETTAQRKQALGQLDGRLSAVAEGWRARLLAISAPLEADVDFPDEGGVPAAVAARAVPAIEQLENELAAYRSDSAAARAIRDGVRVAILGRPNAGKSSLLNQLAGSDMAIVSATPGTTRDVIEVKLDLGGVPVIVADTAGLRDQTTDDIEREGMRRAMARAEEADIRIMVIDPLTEENSGEPIEAGAMREGDFLVVNKLDLRGESEAAVGLKKYNNIKDVSRVSLSAKTGEGLPEFVGRLTEAVGQRTSLAGDAALTRARHVRAVDDAVMHLAQAKTHVTATPELAAEDVRMAARALGGITGAVDVEDILGEIFSSFCIGK